MNYDNDNQTAHVKLCVKDSYGENHEKELTVQRHELTNGTRVYDASVRGSEAGWYESEKEAIEELAKWLERTADALFDFVAEKYRPAIAHVSSARKLKVPKTCYHCRHCTADRWCNLFDEDIEDNCSSCTEWEPTENCEGVD